MLSVNRFFNIFRKNARIRANSPLNTELTESLIMRGMDSKRCEDALCLDCVPGFCRERHIRVTTPRPLAFVSNGTVVMNGFPNVTVSGLPMINTMFNASDGSGNSGNPTTNQNQSFLSFLNNFGANQNFVNLQQNLRNMAKMSNFIPGSHPGSHGLPAVNTTAVPPISTTHRPHKLCTCSWIR